MYIHKWFLTPAHRRIIQLTNKSSSKILLVPLACHSVTMHFTSATCCTKYTSKQVRVIAYVNLGYLYRKGDISFLAVWPTIRRENVEWCFDNMTQFYTLLEISKHQFRRHDVQGLKKRDITRCSVLECCYIYALTNSGQVWTDSIVHIESKDEQRHLNVSLNIWY